MDKNGGWNRNIILELTQYFLQLRHQCIMQQEKDPLKKKILLRWRNSVPISLGQEYGDPDNEVMVFFASDSSKFISQLIPVDGGQTAGL